MLREIQVGEETLQAGGVRPFVGSISHLLSELERIDLLLQIQIQRARALQSGNNDFQGLCISEEEVDSLLARPCGLPRWADHATFPDNPDAQAQLKRLLLGLDTRRIVSLAQGVRLRLDELARLFNLTRLDLDIVLICLAGEMDSRYEKLYAYLQDDVTRKRPTIDLVLNLLCSGFEEKLQARSRFNRGSPLIGRELIHLFVDPSQPEPTLLRTCCKLDERIVQFLLDRDEIDERLRKSTVMVHPGGRPISALVPEELLGRMKMLADETNRNGRHIVFYLQGSWGVDRQSISEALCHDLGLGILTVSGKAILESPGLESTVRWLLREARLQTAAIHWRGFEAASPADKAADLLGWLRRFADGPGISFLDGDAVWEPPAGQPGNCLFFRVELSALNRAQRRLLWDQFLRPDQCAQIFEMETISARFRLNAEHIRAAATTAQNLARWREPDNPQVNEEDLSTACRLHSNRKLVELTRCVQPRYKIEDIVLPDDQLLQLRETIDQAKHRHTVLGDWGFDRKLSLGKGLNALFSGPPGTGKTMAAEVIAHELRLDLYKLDLSQVVSKYIGETEKNLDRIFGEAQGSNAVLLFDEADALFGRRSEVKDAHDRFANIEIGYLLQKMEEYEGIAILATNLRQNMDEAFLRRMHVIIEFPFPDEAHRRQIWQRAFPREAPVGEDVDFTRLARDVRLAGGSIKNIALSAAFYAATNGKRICMPHLLQAASREHQKLGRTWSQSESVSPPVKHAFE